ncbi:MAG TPA: helix-turn-helix domain-containing protein [Chthonomonas sp.]|uniref:helix-turn-helix domain-containing protein n=1 Tax=Chthonomonas sp. TaxID=2282153 RepID=UPI002B4B03A2|nr:helix-turn-helix domain-containing protein [Chthonomonas sp.]HLI47165.1 helix-turn-helix domain-containing protein [Chthonomonas sp.]
MRLEEWQKYLEARFVDEEEAEPPIRNPALEQTQTSSEPETAQADPPTSSLPEAVTTNHTALTMVETVPVTATAPIPTKPIESPQDETVAQANRHRSLSLFPVVNRERPTCQASTSSIAKRAPKPSSDDSEVLEVNIPDFAQFLPPNHPAAAPPKEWPRKAEPKKPAATTQHEEPLSAIALHRRLLERAQQMFALQAHEHEEAVQGYYKRPFQETRTELIERLFDPELSLEDVARLLNVCPTTVRRYTNLGWLVCHRKEPEHSQASQKKETRQRRFRLSALLAFIETYAEQIAADRIVDNKNA